MATTGRTEAEAPSNSDVAAQLHESSFVGLYPVRTGDAIAATGVLARSLDSCGIPYQVALAPLPAEPCRETDADVTVALGRPMDEGFDALGDDGPTSGRAFAIARELEEETDRSPSTATVELALTGVLSAGETPPADLLDAADEAGLDRRPGVGVPTANLIEGVAYTTGFHTSISGSPEETAETLAGVDGLEGEDAGKADAVDSGPAEATDRTIASLVSLTVAADEELPASGAQRFQRCLNTHESSRYRTTAGFADVLRATAAVAPGTALELALGTAEQAVGLDCWRDVGQTVHSQIRDAETNRYDGLVVVETQTGDFLDVFAQLVVDYRAAEPLVLAVTDGEAVARRSIDAEDDALDGFPLGERIEQAAASVDGVGRGTAVRGRATFDVEPTEFAEAFREVA